MPTAGQLIGSRYRLEASLHEGGAGSVWTAIDSQSQQKVALKLLSETLPDLSSNTAWFVQRARAGSNPVHPTFVKVDDLGQTEQGIPFVATELLTGTSLRDTLTQAGTLSPVRAVIVLRLMLEALSEAHRLGMAHGNLKPSNVILSAAGTPGPELRILNLGLSRPMLPTAGVPTPDQVLGTLDYTPPERLTQPDAAPTPATDAFACGVILSELLTGHTPLAPLKAGDIALRAKLEERRSFFASGHSLPLPSQTLPNLSPGLSEVVRRATLGDFTQRFSDAAQMLAGLSAAVGADPSLADAKGTLASTLQARGGAGAGLAAAAPPQGLDDRPLDKTVVAGNHFDPNNFDAPAAPPMAPTGPPPPVDDRETMLFGSDEENEEDLKTSLMMPEHDDEDDEIDEEETIQADVIPDELLHQPQSGSPLADPFGGDTELDEDEDDEDEDEEPPPGYARTMVFEPPSSPEPSPAPGSVPASRPGLPTAPAPPPVSPLAATPLPTPADVPMPAASLPSAGGPPPADNIAPAKTQIFNPANPPSLSPPPSATAGPALQKPAEPGSPPKQEDPASLGVAKTMLFDPSAAESTMLLDNASAAQAVATPPPGIAQTPGAGVPAVQPQPGWHPPVNPAGTPAGGAPAVNPGQQWGAAWQQNAPSGGYGAVQAQPQAPEKSNLPLIAIIVFIILVLAGILGTGLVFALRMLS